MENCSNCDHCLTVDRAPKLKRDLTVRLNKIEGQIKGIKTMIEKDCYYDDVLIQLTAAQSALSSVGKILIESHMKNCITERLKNGDEDAIQEFIKTLGRVMK